MAINRHGVPKDATKAELKKIRATGSPGAKKLAHWKLNMHHNTEAVEDIKQRLRAKSNRVKDALMVKKMQKVAFRHRTCLLYTSPSPRDATLSRMPSSA